MVRDERLLRKAIVDEEHVQAGTAREEDLEYTGYFPRLVERVRILNHDWPARVLASAAMAREYLETQGWCPTHVQHLFLSEEIERVYIAGALKAMAETRLSTPGAMKIKAVWQPA